MEIGKNKWKVLGTLALTVALIVVDGTIVNVGLPVIMKDLHLSFTNAEWIITIYSLVFSSLLITSGRIADNVGRRKMLIIGIVTFMIGSIMASLSSNITWMLIARVIQGVGGAIALPTTLSAVNTFFKEGKDRVIAFAVWGSVISGMAAVGPLLGGLFTTYASWHWIFWINIPIGLVIIYMAIKFVPESYGEKWQGKFDILGFILSIIGFGSLVFGLIESKNYGWWTPKMANMQLFGISIVPYFLGLGVIALILFIMWENHLAKNNRSALLSLKLFNIRSFSIGNIIACVVAVGEFGLLFVLPLYLQNALELSAMQAGLILSLMGVGAFFAGGMATPFVRKTSAKTVVSTGLLVESLSLLGFFLTTNVHTNVIIIGLWLLVYGIGLGFASAQLTSIVMEDVPNQNAGQGSSVQSTVRQLGSALGVAIIGTIFASLLSVKVPGTLNHVPMEQPIRSGLEQSVIKSAGSSIRGIEKDKMLPDKQRTQIVDDLKVVFTKSVDDVLGISALILFGSFVITMLLPKKDLKKNS